MSHELEITDGVANMIWTNEVPWHGLGTTTNDRDADHRFSAGTTTIV